MESEQQFSNIQGSSFSATKSSRRPKLIVFFVLFLVLLGGSIYAGSRFLGSSEGNTENTLPTAAPTPTLSAAAASETIDESEDKEPSPTSGAGSPTPTGRAGTAELDRESLTIAVENGSGEAGVAGEMADVLRDLGYTVSSTGNADDFDHEDVTIQVKSTKARYLDLLEKDLAGSYTVAEATSDLAGSASTDALVIVGK